MKTLTISIILFLVNFTLLAQNSTIKGTIIEAGKNEVVPVAFANIYIKGSTIGTTTDFDGNYSFTVAPGKYTLITSYIGFISDSTELTVASGETKTHFVSLKSNSQVLKEFVVEAKQNRETETVLLMEQKQASTISQQVGSKELSEKGASDVAEGVAKVSGVTKSSSSNVIFFRGLGDRYNNATLNGLPVPSSNPDLKVISLDLFPTSIVQSIEINKTFNPEMYGDFAGGTVDIRTKDYPEEKFLVAGVSSTISTATTFKPFKKTDGDKQDNFGYENGDRNMPSEVNEELIYRTDAANPSSPFSSKLNPITTNAKPDQGISLSGGNYWKRGKNGLGALFVLSHENEYRTLSGNNRFFDTYGDEITNFNFNRYQYSTGTSALTSLTLKLGENSQISHNLLYVHDSENELSYYDSNMPDRDRFGYNMNFRNTLAINEIVLNQIHGKHKLTGGKLNVRWDASTNSANSSEPDRIQILYNSRSGNKDDYQFQWLNAPDNHRYFNNIDEKEHAGRVDATYIFKKDSGENSLGSVSIGTQAKLKSRTFEWRQVNMKMDKLGHDMMENEQYVTIDNAAEYLSDENLENSMYYYVEQVDPSRTHYIFQNVYSPYAFVNYDLVPNKLKMVVGSRVEIFQQTLRYKKLGDLLKGNYRELNQDNINVLPALSFKYSVNEKSNLRFAFGKTLSRPSMKELGPFQYQEQSGALNEGNPELTSGQNYNVDLKYEIFPNSGELIAVSAFGKYLINPIERAQIPSSGILYSYFNMGSATVAGLELEVSKKLSTIIGSEGKVLNNFSFGFNASYLYSKLVIGDEIETNKGTILATNNERPMFGASPFIFNADISYKALIGKVLTNWALTYNISGKKVYAAGTQDLGDVYEMPVNGLNLIVKNKINDKISLDFSLKNLLNPTYVQQQEIEGKDYIMNEFKRGRFYGISLSYKIF